MGKTAILAVKIISDASGGTKGLSQVETSAGRMEKRLSRASGIAKVGLLAIAGAAGFAAKSAADDERSQALLANTLRKSAGATNAQIAATERFIDSTARATGVADDQLRPALSTLVRATGDLKTGQGALSTAMDVAAATGKPLQTVSAALAKAYGGQTTSLGKLVPGLSKAVLQSGDMTKITAELARITGGSAAAAANTAAGKYDRMQVALGEAAESIGGALLPAMTKLGDLTASAANFAGKHSTAVQVAAGVVAGLAVAILLVNGALAVYNAGVVVATAASSAGAIVTGIQTVAQYALGTAWLAGRVAALAFAAGQRALNAALKNNPIGLVVTAVTLLIAGLVLAYKKSATFRTIVNAVGKAGQTAIGWVVTKAVELWRKIQTLGPVLNTAKEIAVKAFRAYTTPIRVVINTVKELIDWIKHIKFPSVPKAVSDLAGGKGGPPVRGPATGGATSAYSSLTGRGGPGGGAFVSSVGGSRGGQVIQINISGALDPDATARQIEKLLRRRGIRLGRAV